MGEPCHEQTPEAFTPRTIAAEGIRVDTPSIQLAVRKSLMEHVEAAPVRIYKNIRPGTSPSAL